ncbi:Transcription initiation factor TFIID subunit 5 [Clydaea vesicula]|uniref:Transcription initiation factor TFIID subunit 5 n=1 Tax=Clydaea vesicula TaxID=447962 RepID=A0AAD5U8F6_9FUNG|nr:Transcription initiation factor TFIID subunit 5 [Clydaea vesicula]
MSNEDVNMDAAVSVYLRNRGYKEADSMLKQEANLLNSRKTQKNLLDLNIPDLILYSSKDEVRDDPNIYSNFYSLLRNWINESSLDLYKFELRRCLFPIFVYSYLNLVESDHPKEAQTLMKSFEQDHQEQHSQDLEKLSCVLSKNHLVENEFVKEFKSSKYKIRMSRYSFELLLSFLQNNKMMLILRILNEHLAIKVTTDKPRLLNQDESDGGAVDNEVDGIDDDKINLDQEEVKLGTLPADPWLVKELDRCLREGSGFTPQEMPFIAQELQKLKKENPLKDSPKRDSIPLPPPKLLDIQQEIKTLNELRSKIILNNSLKPTICSYTLHNTYENLTCAKFSPSSTLIGGGFSDSLVKVWNVKGVVNPKQPTITMPSDPRTPTKLVGHSGPVYGMGFSPDNNYLISCSEDKTARLWSLLTESNLAVYKGHNYPVWDCEFGPLGVYFATCSHDRTARLWSTDHIYPLRIFVGHLSDVDCVKFHPNNNYLLTGSLDRTLRLWDLQRGHTVRLLSRHNAGVTCCAISPDGRMAASSGEDKVIMIWDLGTGKLIKKMVGHESAVQTLEFSLDGKVLTSGGLDYTVRVWDCKTGDLSNNEAEISGENRTGNPSTTATSNDLLHTFYTKKTPIFDIKYGKNSNILLTVGPFLP